MTAKEVLDNIKGYVGYEIANYPLCEKEAKVIVKALENLRERDSESGAEDVLRNIEGYADFDVSNYPLRENEAEIAKRALLILTEIERHGKMCADCKHLKEIVINGRLQFFCGNHDSGNFGVLATKNKECKEQEMKS